MEKDVKEYGMVFVSLVAIVVTFFVVQGILATA